MLDAGHAGIGSSHPDGLPRMMVVIVVACQEFLLTGSEKAELMHLWPVPSFPTTALHIEEAGQDYRKITKSIYFGGVIDEDANICHRNDVPYQRCVVTARGVQFPTLRSTRCSGIATVLLHHG